MTRCYQATLHYFRNRKANKNQLVHCLIFHEINLGPLEVRLVFTARSKTKIVFEEDVIHDSFLSEIFHLASSLHFLPKNLCDERIFHPSLNESKNVIRRILMNKKKLNQERKRNLVERFGQGKGKRVLQACRPLLKCSD